MIHESNFYIACLVFIRRRKKIIVFVVMDTNLEGQEIHNNDIFRE